MVERRKVAALAVGGLVVVLCLTGWLGYVMREGRGTPEGKSRRASTASATAAERRIKCVMPASDEAAADPTAWAMAAAVGHGRLYFGTDNDGVWYHGPAAGSEGADGEQGAEGWKQVDTARGLGESAVMAMATDLVGRVWVGHFSQGVSVFNGQTWGRYDTVHGPLGGHVYDIEVCPTDGDVWMATDTGLTRYRQEANEWQYFTAANGLPSNQIRCVAFGRDGTAYVGTYCEGVAIARAADGYRQWTTVKTPGQRRMPLSASGEGLPSNATNGILVGRDGTVYVATVSGLGISKDSGVSWTFMRGRDWSELVKGLKGKPLPEESGASAPLAEDWCCTLAEDGAGRIWIAHRHRGSSVFDPSSGQVRICSTGSGGGGIRTLVPLPGTAEVLLGTYGPDKRSAGGFRIARLDDATAEPSEAVAAAPEVVSPLPKDAAAPSLAELRALAVRVKALPASSAGTAGSEGGWLAEDWATHGDWVGRYGQGFADVIAGPRSGSGSYNVQYITGPHTKPGGTETWHYNAAATGDNPYWLWSPMAASRCIGEINDGGWNDRLYPTTWEGPDLWITFTIPKGVHRVAPFFMGGSSADGHFRDYVVELKSFTGDVVQDDSVPPLASARVTDYWHTLYSQFVISRPGRYAIKVGRCQSHMAGINGLMIDRLDAPAAKEQPRGYSAPVYGDADLRGPDDAATQRIAAAVGLWQALDHAWDREGNFALQRPYRLLAYRAAMVAGAGQALLDNWRWKLCLWTDADRAAFGAAMSPEERKPAPGAEPATFP